MLYIHSEELRNYKPYAFVSEQPLTQLPILTFTARWPFLQPTEFCIWLSMVDQRAP